MAGTNRASIQSLLVGIPLPAGRRELVEYARAQGADPEVIAALGRLSDRRFASLPEVGEAIEPRAPEAAASDPVPRAESGGPPGGAAYTRGEAGMEQGQ